MEHYYTSKPTTPHDIHTIKYRIKDTELTLMTDAGVFSKTKADFGSDLLIKSLPPMSGQILDLGCGYGVIGISIAKLNINANLVLCDINERAVELANKNIALNHITNAKAIQSDGFENITGRYSSIVSNPPIRAGKQVIYPMFEQSIDYLVPGGSFYIVIQKKQGAPSAVDKLISIYSNCETINKSAGYWILRSTKNND